jgi:hypothetical protein
MPANRAKLPGAQSPRHFIDIDAHRATLQTSPWRMSSHELIPTNDNMRLLKSLVFFSLPGCTNAASLILIPPDDGAPSQRMEGLYNLALNFRVGAESVLVTSADVGFNVAPPDLAAWLVPGGVFDPLNPPPGAISANSVSSSQELSMGLAFDFPDTLFAGGSYFSVFFTFSSFGGLPAYYASGAYDEIQESGVGYFGVIVSDSLGNPKSLAVPPNMVINGAVVPEAGSVALFSSGMVILVMFRRANRKVEHAKS